MYIYDYVINYCSLSDFLKLENHYFALISTIIHKFINSFGVDFIVIALSIIIITFASFFLNYN